MKIPQSAVDYFLEPLPTQPESICWQVKMTKHMSNAESIHPEMDRMNGYICCLEIFKDSVYRIIEYSVPLLDVKVQYIVYQYDDRFDLECVGGGINFHKSGASEVLDFYLQHARSHLQSRADRAISTMKHCCRHYKDKKNYNLLTPKQKTVVHRMWNAMYNYYHIAGSKMDDKEFNSLFKHHTILCHLKGE